MVYKRYIKRGNKIYGPYIYHNQKKNGKVISTYLGKHSEEKNSQKNNSKHHNLSNKGSVNKFEERAKANFPYKRLLLFLFVSFALIAYLVFLSQLSFTGRVTLSVEDVYAEGEMLNGNLEFVLQQSELMPVDTKVIINSAGSEHIYNLSDLISETPIEGDYYIKSKDVSGSGLGYGTEERFPFVNFVLGIFSEPEDSGSDSGDRTVPVEPENETEGSSVNESETPEEVPEDLGVGEIPPEEEPVEEPTETPTEEETPAEPEEPQDSGIRTITGNAIGTLTDFFVFVPRFVGHASLELIEEIEGNVSANSSYVYILGSGDTVQILSAEQPINLTISGNQAIVTTQYTGDEEKQLLINLSELSIPAEEGNLIVSFVYNNTELITATKEINILNETEVVEQQEQVPEPRFQITAPATQIDLSLDLSSQIVGPDSSVTVSGWAIFDNDTAVANNIVRIYRNDTLLSSDTQGKMDLSGGTPSSNGQTHYNAPDGTNVSASSTWSGGNMPEMFDGTVSGSSSDGWIADGTSGQITIYFTDTFKIDKIGVAGRATYAPGTTMDVEVSTNNGSSTTQVLSSESLTTSLQNFTIDDSANWMRINVTDAHFVGINELEIYLGALTTNASGYYEYTLTAPSSVGAYEIKANTTASSLTGTNTSILEVSNEPKHSTPLLNSSSGNNLTSDNLTVYNQSTSDPNSDSVKNIINWYKDETSILSLNMPFEGGSNDSWARDYSGNGLNVTSTAGDPVFSNTSGYDGKGAFDFDGSDNLQVANVNHGDAVTYSMWAYPTATGNRQMTNAPTPPSVILEHNSGLWRARMYDGAASRGQITGPAINLNEWSHLVYVYDNITGRAEFYVNGTSVGNTTAPRTCADTDTIYIGSHPAPTAYFIGKIDEFQIYNKSLSDEQVYALYNNRTDLIVSQETNGSEIWKACITPNDRKEDGVEKCSNNLTLAPEANLIVELLDPSSNANVNQFEFFNFSVNVTCQAGGNNCGNTSVYLDPFNAWEYKREITIDNAKVAGTSHSDFPILINIDSDTSLASNALSNGDDILFTDDSGTQLSHEIDVFNDSTGELVAWVKVPTLSGSSDTTLWIYYGNSGASNQENVSDTWSNGYQAVYHFSEDPSGTTLDSLSQSDQTGVSMESADKQSGEIGTKVEFDGSEYMYNDTGVPNMNSETYFTISGWAEPDSSSSRTLFCATPVYTSYVGMVAFQGFSSYWRLYYDAGTGASRCDIPLSGLEVNGRNHWAWTFNGTGSTNTDKIHYYQNGSEVTLSSCSGTIPSTTFSNGFNAFQIARFANLNRNFDGHLDELRVANVRRSEEWLTTVYNNQDNASAFYTLGEEQANEKGLVSTVSGTTPFYTTNNNPQTVDLDSGESATVEWEVNATGELLSVFEFFAYANITAAPSIGNFSDSVNITIAQGVNSVPTHDTPILNSSDGTNRTTVNLTVYNQSTADVNNDDVKNIIDWKIQDDSIAILNIPFEGGTNGSFARDYSSNGKDLSQSNSSYYPVFSNTSGYDGAGAITFDGNDDRLTFGSFPEMDGLSEFTVTFWIKPRVPFSGWEGIFARGSNPQRVPWIFGNSGNSNIYMQFETESSGSDCSITSATVADDEWSHVAARWNGTHCSIFINNVEGSVDTTSGTGLANTDGNNYVGYMDTYTTLDGSLDELVVWNRSLSDEQISALYNNRTDLIVSQETTPADVWKACITPNDGKEDGTTKCSNTLDVLLATAGNDVPVVETVLINTTNGTHYEYDDLRCWANITDNNDDPIVAEGYWYKDGIQNKSFTTSPTNSSSGEYVLVDTLSSTYTQVGETWTCSVRGYDWLQYGTYVNASEDIWDSSIPGTPCGSCEECTNLTNVSGTVIALTQNLSVVGADCIDMLNDSVTIDCNGYNITGTSGNAIHITGEDNVTIKNCYVYGHQYAVRADGGQNNLIEDSVFDVNTGVLFSGTENNTVRNSVIDGSSTAVYLSDGDGSNVLYNNLTGTQGVYFTGGSRDNNITGNRINCSTYAVAYNTGGEVNNTYYRNYIYQAGFSTFSMPSADDTFCIDVGNYYGEGITGTYVPKVDCGPVPNAANVYVNQGLGEDDWNWGDTNATFTSIQGGIVNANDAATINVLGGTGNYSENIITSKDNQTLDCHGETIDGSGLGIDISGEYNYTVQNCVFYNVNSRINSGSFNSFDNCSYINSGTAVTLIGTDDATVQDCSFGTGVSGAISMNDADGSKIYRNNIQCTNTGVYFTGGSRDNNISENNITCDVYAIAYNTGGEVNNTYYKNRIYGEGFSTFSMPSADDVFCIDVGNYYNESVDYNHVIEKDCGPVPNATKVYANSDLTGDGDWEWGDTNATFTSIQTAVSNAKAGTEIHALAETGPYRGVSIIRDNLSIECHGVNIDNSASESYGIYINARDNISVNECNISGFGSGVYVTTSQDNTFDNLNVSGASNGIYFITTSNSTINNSRVDGGTNGIYLYSLSQYNIIENNTVNGSSYGLRFDDGGSFQNNYNNATNNSLWNNTIQGVRIESGNTENLFWQNNFENNNENVYSLSSTNQFNYSGLGNHWDTGDRYTTCPDDDRNRICDVSYNDGANVNDSYPYVVRDAWRRDYNQYFAADDATTAAYVAESEYEGNLTEGNTTFYDMFVNYTHPSFGKRLSIKALFYDNDVDLDTLKIEAASSKTAVNFTGVSGVANNHSLFIPNTNTGNGVYLCPDANSLNEVNKSCPGIIEFSGAFPVSNLTYTASIEGTNYRIDNVISSGGGTLEGDAPTHAQPILNASSGTNYSNENLTVYNQSTSDGDGDDVKNIIDWRRDASSIMVLNMPFENSSGNLYKDYSTYENNGSAIGGDPTWNATGGYDEFGAYEFDGDLDYVGTADDNTLDIGTGDFSLSAWIYLKEEDANGGGVIVKRDHSSSTSLGYSIVAINNKFLMSFNGNGGAERVLEYSNGNITLNEWTHVVVSADRDSNISMYIDGVLDSTHDISGDTGSIANALSLDIGRFDNGPYYYFNGSIDEVGIWNVSLSAEQVSALYNNRTDLIVSEQTSAGDIWQACITPNDGVYDGAENCSNNLTILNSVPTHAQPILNSTSGNNRSDDNLTVYNQSTLDLDEDNVKNIINWKKNDASIMTLNMPFEGGSNNSYAKDYSGYGNEVVASNGNPIWSSTAGYDGRGAFVFDGSSGSYLNITNTTSLEMEAEDFTISFWANIDAYTNIYGGIISWDYTGYHPFSIMAHQGDGGVRFLWDTNAGGWDGSITVTTATDTWYHWVMRRDGTNISIWRNGVYQNSGSVSGSLIDINKTMQLGRYSGTNGYEFDGWIDEVQIYKGTAFSDEQISALYNNRTDLIVSQETGIDDVWQACLTPNDGTVDGIENCSNNLTITQNRAPTQSIPILNSSSDGNKSSENLTVWNVSTSDLDGDSVKNIYNWYKNGNSTTVLNMPMEGHNPTYNDVGTQKAYWKFSDNLEDSTSNNHDCTAYGNAAVSPLGKVGKGTYYDGTDDYLHCGESGDWDLSNNNYAISLWIYPLSWNGAGNVDYLIGKFEDVATGRGWILESVNSGSGIRFRYSTDTTNQFANGPNTGLNLETNTWHHIVATRTSSTDSRIYIDGVLVDTNTTDYTVAVPSSTPLQIADRNGGSTQEFNGYIDEVQLWNGEGMNETQVRELYAQGVNSSTETNDYSWSGNEAYPVDDASFDATGGFDGLGAYNLDGDGDYLRVGSNDNLKLYNFTIATWINPAETPDNEDHLIAKCNSGGEGYRIWYWSGKWEFMTRNVGGTTGRVGGSAAAVDEWLHIAAVSNGTHLMFYENGSLVNTSAHDFTLGSSCPMMIGASPLSSCGGSQRYYNGTVDEVLVFNEALSGQQIAALYNSNNSVIVSQETTAGENWSACITGNDGEIDGVEACSNELTVLADNNVPTQDTPWIGAHNVYNNSVVGEWRFENNAVDETGTNNGTAVNHEHSDMGRVGKAYDWEATLGNINIGDNEKYYFGNTTDFTVSSWVKMHNIPNAADGGDILDFRKGSPDYNGFNLGFYWQQISLTLDGGAPQEYARKSVVGEMDDDDWHHVVAVADRDNELRIYLDGVSFVNKTVDTTGLNVTFIGTNYLGRGLNGTLDEVVVWNRTLNSTEVDNLYDSSIGSPSYDNQDLGISANNTEDVDDDDVKNIIDWQISGTSIAVLNMPFEGGSNSSFVRDYSSNGNNVSSGGGDPIWNSAGGYDGKGAFEFDGSGDYLSTAEDDSLDFNNAEFSVSTWVKVGTNVGTRDFVAKYQNSPLKGYLIGMNSNGYPQFWTRDSGASVASVTTSTDIRNDGQWHHIVGVRPSSGNVKIYLDGIETEGGAIANDLDNTNGLIIGYRRFDDSVFNGSIDDVVVYNRSLSAEQVRMLYENQTQTIAQEETQETEWWKACITPNDGIVDGETKCSSQIFIDTALEIEDVSANLTVSSPSVDYTNYSYDSLFQFNATLEAVGGALSDCNVTIYEYSGLTYSESQTQNVASISEGSSENITWTINTTDLSNFYGENYTINVSAECAEASAANVTRIVTVNFSWIVDPMFENQSFNGNTYYVGDFALYKLNITREGVSYDPHNLSVNVTDDNLNFLDLQYINDTIRTGPGIYYGEIDTAGFTPGIDIRFKARIYDDQGGELAEENQADNNVDTPDAADLSSSNFNYSTTSSSNYTVRDLVINNSDAMINWTTTRLNLSDGTYDLDNIVNLSYRFAYVKSDVYPEFNRSVSELFAPFKANITIQNVSCQGYEIFFSDNVSAITYDEVISENTECPAGVCENISCNNDVLTFIVNRFTGYAVGDNANLTIWDETDSGVLYGDQTKFAEDNVNFFANYTNKTSGEAITDATCFANFADSQGNAMTWNSTDSIYVYNRTFSSDGEYEWNVTCNKSGFSNLTSNDNVTISAAACDYYLDSCKTSGWEANKVYCLNTSINTTLDCMDIDVGNVTLDCQGYILDGDDGTADYGFFNDQGYDYVNVYNCIIQNFGDGIRYYNTGLDAEHGQIKNCTLYDNNLYGFNGRRVYNISFENNTFDSAVNDQTYNLYANTGGNITVENCSFDDAANYGLYLQAVDDSFIRYNTFDDEELYFGSNSDNALIEYNNFSNYQQAIYASCSSGSNNCSNMVIRHNLITSDTNDAIYLNYAPNISIYNNTFDNVGNGAGDEALYLSNSLTGHVYNNTITNGAGYGLYLQNSDEIIIENNSIIDNGDSGIYLFSLSDNNEIKNNIIYSNTDYGVYILDSSNTILEDNNLSANTFGLVIEGDAASELNVSANSNNTVDGKYIYFVSDLQDTIIDGWTNLSMFGCYNCDNVSLNNIELQGNSPSILIQGTTNSVFENINISGGGTETTGKSGAVYVFAGTGNNLTNLRVVDGIGTTGIGILLRGNNATITDSYVQDFFTGIYHYQSDYANITRTTVYDNGNYGVYFNAAERNIYNNCTFDSVSNDQVYDAYLTQSHYNVFANSTFNHENTYSIYSLNSDNNNFTDNLFLDEELYFASGCDNVLIEGNNFSTINQGIYFACSTGLNTCDDPIIKDNFISSDLQDAVYFNYLNGGEIYNNTIEDSGNGAGDEGILMQNTINAHIYNNTIDNPFGYGVSALNIDNCTFENNTILSVGNDGIRLATGSTGNNITGNNFTDSNGYGVYLNSVTGNLIWNNWFNNTNNAFDNSGNDWNISKTAGTNIIGGNFLGGNFWDDYTGEDNTGDGLGDTLIPYDSGGDITGGDYLPLVEALVGNFAPVIQEIFVNSSSGYNVSSDNLTCWVSATDANEENVSYSGYWYKNAAENISFNTSPTNYTQGTLVAVSILLSGNTSISENWSCNVTAYDDQNYSAYNISDNLTIEANAPPTHAQPILSSSSNTNTTSENLTVHNQSTFDADGDLVKNIINWYKNSTSLTVLNMPFEGGSNSTFTKDYSNNANGSVSGATFSNTSGYDGRGAYDFDGVSDTINISDSNLPSGSANRTIILWMNPNTVSTTGIVFGYGTVASGQQFYVYTGLDGSGTISIGWNGHRTGTNSVINADEWSMLAVVTNGTTTATSNHAIYVNGESKALSDKAGSTKTLNTVLNGLAVIGSSSEMDTPFNGTIDDVTIFNRSLSAEQIFALYNNKTDLIVSQETVLGDNFTACITPNDGQVDGEELCSNQLLIREGINLIVNLTSPQDYLFVNETNEFIDFNCSVSDSDLKNMTLQIWNSSGSSIHTNTSNISGSSNYSEFSYNVTDEGVYEWNCLAFNNEGFYNSSDLNRTFIVGNGSSVVVNLLNPENNSIRVQNNVTFIFYASSVATGGDLNCSLILDGSNVHSFEIPQGRNFTSYNVPDGEHNWSIMCIDNNSNPGFSDTYNLTVDTGISDTTAPSVQLRYPNNARQWYNAPRNISLMYNASDDYGDVFCTLYSNFTGTWQPDTNHFENYPVAESEVVNTLIENMDYGTYMWNVLCEDSSGNSAWGASNYTFIIKERVACFCDSCETCTAKFIDNSCANVSQTADINWTPATNIEACINKSNVLDEIHREFIGEGYQIKSNTNGWGIGILLGSGEPIDIILSIDSSGSMSGSKMSDAKDAANDFVDEVDLTSYDVGIVDFDTTATLVENLTSSSSLLHAAINALDAGGYTAIGDGINVALDTLENNNQSKAIILMSDGQHNTGSDPYAAALRAVEMNATIFTIGFGGDADETMLKEIAEITYGTYYFAPTGDALKQVYLDIINDHIQINDHVIRDVNITRCNRDIEFNSVTDSEIINATLHEDYYATNYWQISITDGENITVRDSRPGYVRYSASPYAKIMNNNNTLISGDKTIQLTNSDNSTIYNNTGVELAISSSDNCNISYNDASGLVLSGFSFSIGGNNNIIEYNNASGNTNLNGGGIIVGDGYNISVKHNIMSYNGDIGFSLGANDSVIENNTANYNGDTGFNINYQSTTFNELPSTFRNNTAIGNDRYSYWIDELSCDTDLDSSNVGGDTGKPLLYFNHNNESQTFSNSDAYSELYICNASDMIIDNITIYNPVYTSDGMVVMGADNATIRNSNSSSVYRSLYVEGRSEVAYGLNSNDLNATSNLFYDSQGASNIYSGIHLSGEALRPWLYNNTIKNAYAGIVFNQDNATVIDNTIENTTNFGIWGGGENGWYSGNNISHAGSDSFSIASSNNVTLFNNSVYYGGSGADSFSPAIDNGNISNNYVFSSGGRAYYLLSADNNTIQGNIVNFSEETGIYCNGGNNTVIDNEIYNSKQSGIQVATNDVYRIINNTVVNSSYTTTIYAYGGIHASVHNVTIEGNNVSNVTGYGIVLYLDINDSNITNNIIENASDAGIYTRGSNVNNPVLRANISENTIINSGGDGIFFEQYTNDSFVFRNNVSSSNGYSIKIGATGNGNNTIYDNFFASSSNVDDQSAGNIWNTSYSCGNYDNIIGGNCSGGNYWSNYNGTDDGSGSYPNNFSNDGIGDTELPWKGTATIDVGGDYLPLVYPPTPVTPPTWNNNDTNVTNGTTKYNDAVYFSINWSDDTAMTNSILSWNSSDSGSFTNLSSYDCGGSSYCEHQEIVSIPITKGEHYCWRFYGIDEFGNTNFTDTWCFVAGNSLPTVELYYPEDGIPITDRTPTFIWNGTDVDNDTMTYDIEINLTNVSSCLEANRSVTGISEENHTASPFLKCFYDNLDVYYWRVRASDDGGSTYGDWSSTRELRINSLIDISLPQSTIEFGVVNLGSEYNTSDDDPLPFLLQNDGNCIVNISANATLPFSAISGESNFYRYKIDNNTGEEGSFSWLESVTAWTQMPIVSRVLSIASFNWIDSTDTAEVDLSLTIPSNESVGDKETIVYFESELHDGY